MSDLDPFDIATPTIVFAATLIMLVIAGSGVIGAVLPAALTAAVATYIVHTARAER